MKELRLTLLLSAFVLSTAGLSPAASAAIQVVAPTLTTAGSVTFTNPITFTIGTAGDARIFVLDNWVTFDGSQTPSILTPGLSLSINGGASTSRPGRLFDNLMNSVGSIDSSDGYFILTSAFAVAVNDTVTLDAATYRLGIVQGFNPMATQTFTGNIFLTDANGTLLSNVVSAGAIPEPSTYALALLGGAGLLGVVTLRRRRAAHLA